MGGTIRVVSIVDGRTHVQSRWTNVLAEYVKDWRFMTIDKKYISTYLNAESAYAQEIEYFAPINYGLDVFDFDNKRIYTCQDYCSHNTVELIGLKKYVNGKVWRSQPGVPIAEKTIKPGDEDYYPDTIKKMWDNNYLKLVCIKDIKKSRWEDPNSIVNYYKRDVNIEFEEVYSIMCEFVKAYTKYLDVKDGNFLQRLLHFNIKTPKYNIIELEIDWEAAGWQFKEFDGNCKEEVIEYFNLVKEQYSLKNEDIKVWQQYINEIET